MSKKVSKTNSADAPQDGEVPLSTVSPAEEAGLSNGLGLERFIDQPPAGAKPSASAASKKDSPKDEPDPKKASVTAESKAEAEDDDPDQKGDEKSDDVEALKKRLKDTRDWATKLAKEKKAQDRELAAIRAKQVELEARLNGTYVEPPQPTAEQLADLNKLDEKIKLSRVRAEERYGSEYVQKAIFEEGSPYRELEQMDPAVKARVFAHAEPVMEAIRVLEEKAFFDKYGREPKSILAKIKAEVEQELIEGIKNKKGRKGTIDDVSHLSNVAGVGVKREDGVQKPPSTVNLHSIFGSNFPTGSA
jgi:hypothetical protein